MSNKYKQAKTLDEQIEHLKSSKNVVFNECSEEDAKTFLLRHNYINVITPFKHRFFDTDRKKNPIKVNGDHVYSNETDFMRYIELYNKERSRYKNIYQNIFELENLFRSILSYVVINEYQLNGEKEITDFFDILKRNIVNNKIEINQREYMNNTILKLIEEHNKYKNIYLLLEYLSFRATLNVFKLLDVDKKKRILSLLANQHYVAEKYFDVKKFEEKIFNIVKIRNVVFHGNSLEILIWYTGKEKQLRQTSSRKTYLNLIQLLDTKKTI